MAHVHVCLVSDQTIPNILGIYHFQPDRLLFITTNAMEKKRKTQAIIDTLGLLGHDYSDRYERVEVLEDSILDCHRKIESTMQRLGDVELSVNLTNGTKIMSIAAYEFFKDYGSKMIYIPINKNEYITPFPKKAHIRPETLSLRLSVREYLAAYGLNVVNYNKLTAAKEEALKRSDLSIWLAHHYESVKNLLVCLGGGLREHRDDKKSHDFSGPFEGPNELEKELIGRMGMSYSNGIVSKRMSRSEIRYITGGWLEEFCFCELAKYLEKGINDVQLGVKLSNVKGTENEFDVMFTKDNALYLVECKTLDQHNINYRDVLYKIGALQRDFGLRVSSFWVTTSAKILKNDDLAPAVSARAEQFNTTIIPPQEVKKFGSTVANKLKINR